MFSAALGLRIFVAIHLGIATTQHGPAVDVEHFTVDVVARSDARNRIGRRFQQALRLDRAGSTRESATLLGRSIASSVSVSRGPSPEVRS